MADLILYDRERVSAWVAKKINHCGVWPCANAFGVEMKGEIVAGVVLEQINGANAVCHIAIEKPCKAMLSLFSVVCDYAFRQLGLKRITGFVSASDTSVIEFDKRLGFEEEFVMKDAAFDGDVVVLVLRADNCRWLPKG